MVPSMVNEIYIIRFAVCAKYPTVDDMRVAFKTIQDHANKVLEDYRAQRSGRQSSSNDSLDAAAKQTANLTNNTEQENVAVEQTNPVEEQPDTANARVNQCVLFFILV